MTTYAALLRGINVGGHKKVPMAELRQLMTDLGWTGVRTYVQSGNAVFSTDEAGVGARLEEAIAGHFGFEVRCVVRTAQELRAIAAACPYPAAELDPAKLLVLFLERTPDPGYFGSVDAAAFEPDTFRHIGDVVYCYFPEGMGRSKLPAALGALRPSVTMTGRNWRTLQRLIELTS
ncbi:MAG: DUF1697 domain-containing protein [Streptomyces sp.]|uniref:DUF1697 domain-containing protein n=1 Tax=Streptomyces sp. TaxID=1931 RepID=UPI003D6C3D28